MTRAPQTAPTGDELRRLRHRLRLVRRGGRTLLAVREASRVFSVALVLTAALVLLDYAARFPEAFRWVLLATLVGAGVAAYRRRFLPVTRFRPPLVDIAHRVEHWLAARTGDRPGAHAHARLTAGVGLRGRGDDDPLTRALLGLAAADLAGMLPRVPWGVLRWRRPALSLAGLVVIAVAGAAAVNAAPALSITGLTRLFTPWAGAEWPRLTAIADASEEGVHPADAALPLRAVLTRSNREPGQSRVTMRYRFVNADGLRSPESEAVLVPQPTGPDGKELYERLIEPSAWTTRAEGEAGPGERTIEYSFASEDDRTPVRRIRIVDPPVLVSARVRVTPPAYASGLLGSDESGSWVHGERPVARRDAAVGPVLFGSETELVLDYSKTVTPAALTVPEGARVSAEGTTIRVAFSPGESAGLSVSAADADGLATREVFRARLAVVTDRPPTAAVVEPGADRAVLSTAVLPLEGLATDDLGLARVRLESRIATPDPESLGSAPEPRGEATVLVSEDLLEAGAPLTSGAGVTNRSLRATLDLSAIGAEAGQEIWITAIAEDAFELGGERHAPVTSAPRRIRIIEESRLIELIQGELAGVRRNAISLDRRQAAVAEDGQAAAEAGDAEGLEDAARRQAGLAQRLRAQASALERIAERVEQNRVEDESIRELLREAGQRAEAARGSADRAAGRAADRAAGNASADPGEDQQQVREELARLIDALDRGQDDWVVRRAIERLAESQRELREQTGRIGEQTAGRELGELTPDERTELERIADRQRELAERAQEAIDDLSAKADELRESDPTQAAALDEAARSAMQRQVAEAMREAGAELSDNQTGEAGRLQEQTIQDLEAMLEGLENARRMRDQALRRELASVIQTIRSLIRQQRAAIDAIDGEIGDARRAAERVRTNTLAAAADARGGFAETAGVADLLDRAAQSQLEAVVALRGEPAAADAARTAGTAALARLEEALAEAQRQDDDAAERERQRQRRELLDAYRGALESQVALRERAGGFDPGALTRRARAELRAIGRDQEALRIEIESIPGEYELPDGTVVSLFHGRIDDALSRAVRRLGRGAVDAAVLGDQDSALALLREIVAVLSPQDQPDEPFDDQQGGGGGGGGGQGGQDQPAIGQVEELRLLRSLQGIVLEQTRAAGERGGASDEGLAAIQREIAEQATRLIESMQGGGANPSRPGGGTDENPERPEEPADEGNDARTEEGGDG
jgi:hypothetical protein